MRFLLRSKYPFERMKKWRKEHSLDGKLGAGVKDAQGFDSAHLELTAWPPGQLWTANRASAPHNRVIRDGRFEYFVKTAGACGKQMDAGSKMDFYQLLVHL